MDEYETIKNARAKLQETQGNPPSQKTIAGYKAKAKRLMRLAIHGEGQFIERLIKRAKETQSVSTWFSRRAALSYSLLSTAGKLLSEQDVIQRKLKAENVPQDSDQWNAWRQKVERIQDVIYGYERLQKEPGPLLEERRPRQSKRKHLRGLPENWREQIVAKMPKYREAVLTQAVTGCRPDELTKGVKLSIVGAELIAEIQGSKVTEMSGQPWRRMTWPVDNESPLVAMLVEAVRGGLSVAQIRDAKAYSGAVRAAGKRAWPQHPEALAPYCFRHQAASDMKTVGMPDDAISQALGHCADVARGYYGQWKQGRRAGGVAPKSVEAARKIRIKKPAVVLSKSRRVPNAF